MDETQAAALRKEFPAGAIGKLPKPYKKDSPRSQCRECGGYHGMPAVHLDYVGHAATTSRLLEVDPQWSWEPMAYDMSGLPQFDGNRNLWIKLTVCGVTRIGVGDGNSLKECIGDAIRNAAMRFGVALDLWAKEDLHAMDEERGTAPEPNAAPTAPATTRTMSRTKRAEPTAPASEPEDGWMPPADTKGADNANPSPITAPQSKMLHAALSEAGMGERVAGLAFLSDQLDREVGSSKDLTKAEASKVIDALVSFKAAS